MTPGQHIHDALSAFLHGVPLRDGDIDGALAALNAPATQVRVEMLLANASTPVAAHEALRTVYPWVRPVLVLAQEHLGIDLDPTPCGSGANGQVFAVVGDPTRTVKITANDEEVRGLLQFAHFRPKDAVRIDRIVPLGDVARRPDYRGDPTVGYAILREAIQPPREDVPWWGTPVLRSVVKPLVGLLGSTLYNWVDVADKRAFMPSKGTVDYPDERAPLAWASDAAFALKYHQGAENRAGAVQAWAEYRAWLKYAISKGAVPEASAIAVKILIASGADPDSREGIPSGAFCDFGPQNRGTTPDGRIVWFDLGFVPLQLDRSRGIPPRSPIVLGELNAPWRAADVVLDPAILAAQAADPHLDVARVQRDIAEHRATHGRAGRLSWTSEATHPGVGHAGQLMISFGQDGAYVLTREIPRGAMARPTEVDYPEAVYTQDEAYMPGNVHEHYPVHDRVTGEVTGVVTRLTETGERETTDHLLTVHIRTDDGKIVLYELDPYQNALREGRLVLVPTVPITLSAALRDELTALEIDTYDGSGGNRGAFYVAFRAAYNYLGCDRILRLTPEAVAYVLDARFGAFANSIDIWRNNIAMHADVPRHQQLIAEAQTITMQLVEATLVAWLPMHAASFPAAQASGFTCTLYANLQRRLEAVPEGARDALRDNVLHTAGVVPAGFTGSEPDDYLQYLEKYIARVGKAEEPPRHGQEPDPRPADEEDAYFVTARYDAQTTAWLLGPYETHADALADVDVARKLVIMQYASDPKAAFAGIGTARGSRRYIDRLIFPDGPAVPTANVNTPLYALETLRIRLDTFERALSRGAPLFELARQMTRIEAGIAGHIGLTFAMDDQDATRVNAARFHLAALRGPVGLSVRDLDTVAIGSLMVGVPGGHAAERFYGHVNSSSWRQVDAQTGSELGAHLSAAEVAALKVVTAIGPLRPSVPDNWLEAIETYRERQARRATGPVDYAPAPGRDFTPFRRYPSAAGVPAYIRAEALAVSGLSGRGVDYMIYMEPADNTYTVLVRNIDAGASGGWLDQEGFVIPSDDPRADSPATTFVSPLEAVTAAKKHNARLGYLTTKPARAAPALAPAPTRAPPLRAPLPPPDGPQPHTPATAKKWAKEWLAARGLVATSMKARTWDFGDLGVGTRIVITLVVPGASYAVRRAMDDAAKKERVTGARNVSVGVEFEGAPAPEVPTTVRESLPSVEEARVYTTGEVEHWPVGTALVRPEDGMVFVKVEMADWFLTGNPAQTDRPVRSRELYGKLVRMGDDAESILEALISIAEVRVPQRIALSPTISAGDPFMDILLPEPRHRDLLRVLRRDDTSRVEEAICRRARHVLGRDVRVGGEMSSGSGYLRVALTLSGGADTSGVW